MVHGGVIVSAYILWWYLLVMRCGGFADFFFRVDGRERITDSYGVDKQVRG